MALGNDGTAIAPLNVTSYFTDPDTGDMLTLSVDPAQLPDGITFDPLTGTFSGTPSSDASIGGPNNDGVYEVVVTAADGHGGTVTTIVTFDIINPAPVARSDVATTSPDTGVTIPVLANDSDDDSISVIAATSPNGDVVINPDGSITFTPGPGFAGVADIVYTISDGQGGTSTAHVKVLVTPQTIVTGVTEVNLPPVEQQSPSPAVTTDGVIINTVQTVDSLGGISNTLGTNGIVVATANQISHLGSLGQSSSTGRTTITDATQPWRIEQALGGYGGHEQGTWDPKGLTGFSLRFTIAEDTLTQGKAQIVLESIVRERTLIVRMSSTELANHAHVLDYSVMQADGKPLPVWLDRTGGDVLMGNRPIDSEELKLRVVARLSDGTTIERHVVIQSVTGEIQPLQLERRADLAPIFTDQLERETRRASLDIDDLALALADRG